MGYISYLTVFNCFVFFFQSLIARVAVRESGKTVLDALIGEVLVTCEKLAWVCEPDLSAL